MKITHLHVYCRDLEPCLAFMTEGLKGKLIKKRLMMGCPGAEIQFDGVVIFLRAVGDAWKAPDLTAGGYNHIGFFVDDLDKTLAEVTAMPGVRLDGEAFIANNTRRCQYVVGPDELYVEFVEEMKQ